MGKDKNEHAVVVSVGPCQHKHMGHFIPAEIKVGDEVVLPTQGFTKIEHNGEEFYVGPENQILARVKSTVADVLAETEPLEESELISEEEFNKLENKDNE